MDGFRMLLVIGALAGSVPMSATIGWAQAPGHVHYAEPAESFDVPSPTGFVWEVENRRGQNVRVLVSGVTG